MNTSARIVPVRISHIRRTPVDHRFSYRGLTWLVDIDDLPSLPIGLRGLSRFVPADHFSEPARAGQSLRDRLNEAVRARGFAAPTGRVLALTSPRVGGYTFNPLSVFWCHDRSGALEYVIAEVHNTYGGRHCYVVHTDHDGRASVGKEFYVSPFNDVEGEYRLRLPEPTAAGEVSLAVVLDRAGQSPFVATMSGVAQPATVPTVLRAQLAAPLAPLVVALRIRIQGLRLWARGLPIVPRPPASRTPDSRPPDSEREAAR